VEVKTKAKFIDPMLLLGTQKLPEGAGWNYEIKLGRPPSTKSHAPAILIEFL